jgi:hypothetical protein
LETDFSPSARAPDGQAYLNVTLSKSSQWLGCF